MEADHLTHKVQQLERLLEVTRTLSGLLELEPLLQSLVDVAMELTHSQEVSILLFDPITKQLAYAAGPWFKKDIMRDVFFPISGSIPGDVFTEGRPVILQDPHHDKTYVPFLDQLGTNRVSSLLAVPLKYQGDPTGVIMAINKEEQAGFSEEDIRVLETLSSQAAIAVKNVGLIKDVQGAYQELSNLDRLKTNFIAITSHELRTPLGLILGHATFLAEMVPEALKAQADAVVRSSVKLKNIIDDLEKIDDFETNQAVMRAARLDIKLLVSEICNSFLTRTAQKKIRLLVDQPSEAVTIMGDVEKISVAIEHLMQNAITFTDEGGVVKVRTVNLPGSVQISVMDTGIGIPISDQEHIFDRFYQVASHMTRRHGGMGLGLSVARNMVEMHGGVIQVESMEGRGSRFTITLPTDATQVKAVHDLVQKDSLLV